MVGITHILFHLEGYGVGPGGGEAEDLDLAEDLAEDGEEDLAGDGDALHHHMHLIMILITN